MADNYENERIRRGLAVLIEDTPLAPEFDDLATTRIRPVHPHRPRPFAIAGLSAAAVLATFVGALIWQIDEPGGSAEPAAEPGASATTLAETPTTAAEAPSTTVVETTATTLADLPPGEFPRVLLDAPDWSITYLDYSESEDDGGPLAHSDTQFSHGPTEAELRMNSGSLVDLEDLITDRTNGASRLADEPIWDTSAVVVGEGGSTFTAMWESNAVEYEFIVYDVDEETFRSLLSSLTQMREEEWIAALPDEIVTDRAAVLPIYLEAVPLPPNFDAAALESGPIEHWYPVAAETISAVSCGWIEVWIDGKADANTDAVQQAIDAMSTSRDWPVFAEMSEVGEFPSGVWEYADAIAGDGTVVGGTILTVEESYQAALGCTG